MPISVTMPALSPTMEEGTLAQWRVKEGDKVAPGDVLAEIETDKATMEVEAIDEGTVGKLLVAEGTEGVPVNKVIALLLEEGESAADIDAGAAEAPAPAPVKELEAAPQPPRSNGEILANPSAKVEAQERGIDLHSVKGTGPHGRITKGDVLAAAEGGSTKLTAHPEPVEGERSSARTSTSSARADSGGRIFASPLARRMAEDKGYALADIEGSGPGGRIVKTDVEAFTPAAKPAEAKPAAEAPATPLPDSEAPYEEVRLTTMRKTIARRMVEAKQTVPHFYLTVDMEIDALLAARKEINETAGEGIKVSVNDLIIRAAGLALMQVPDANVQFAGDKLRRFKRADIAVAVALDGGLITPIIRGANEKGLGAISTEMKELAARAREGKLLPEEYQGGTISISNLGMFGVREFAAVINPPHAAILAIGAGEKRAVVRDNDELAVATVMTVNMACDHRAIDGAIGATYLQALKGLIEHPVRMLL